LNEVCNNFKPKQQEPEPEQENKFDEKNINDIWVLLKILKKIKKLKNPKNNFLYKMIKII
jgi:hypothetical protein